MRTVVQDAARADNSFELVENRRVSLRRDVKARKNDNMGSGRDRQFLRQQQAAGAADRIDDA
ncbi:MAG: hypothetical protein ACRD26_21155 [Vicinamibacterales bacterium]